MTVAHWKPSRQAVQLGGAGTGTASGAALGEPAGAVVDGDAAAGLLELGLALDSAGALLPPQAATVAARAVRTRGSRVRRTAPSCGTAAAAGVRRDG